MLETELMVEATQPVQPPPIQPIAVHQFDPLIASMASEQAWTEGEQTSLALVHHDDLQVALIALREGAALTDPDGSGTATVQVLAGEVSIGAGPGVVPVSTGQLVAFAAGQSWRAEATVDSTVLLTRSRADAPDGGSPAADRLVTDASDGSFPASDPPALVSAPAPSPEGPTNR